MVAMVAYNIYYTTMKNVSVVKFIFCVIPHQKSIVNQGTFYLVGI